MIKTQWMIYGANGYTGELIAREAVRRGLKPILAGRNRVQVEALGQELNLSTRIFPCADPQVITKYLEEISLVLHCAGPFSATSEPMLAACLNSRVHYLDITGEIQVFEQTFKKSRECENAGIVAMPGVGFDVVPSDCLAAQLKRKMPDAVSLAMAMRQPGGISPGSLKTVVEGLEHGGMIRRNGRLEPVSSTYRVRKIRFRENARTCVTIPWGDVSTAFYSTGIPNIEFYSAISPAVLNFLRMKGALKPLLKLRVVKRALNSIIEARIKGPSLSERESMRTLLWGEVTNASGESVELRLDCPESYQLTIDSSLRVVEAVMAGKVLPGTKTPSMALGADFVLSLNDVKQIMNEDLVTL